MTEKTGKRVDLYGRLPEIHRRRDAEQADATPLAAFLGVIEAAFGELKADVEALYDDLFIDTCDPWVIPYLADLLGTSHLAGDPWTLRADVADTIALRRRKGTLGAIERLVYDLSGYGVHAVELRERLVWAQHLNHLRLDPAADRFAVRRGGTATVRDPATLSLLGTAFDRTAHTPDLKRPDAGAIRYNLPNLAIFLWRLETYRTPLTAPVHRGTTDLGSASAGARFVLRFDVDPLGRPMRLFQRGRRDRDDAASFEVDAVTGVDQAPGPIPRARLTSAAPAGNPTAYVALTSYDASAPAPAGVVLPPQGLTLHLPAALFAPLDPSAFTLRGANLCAWEEGLASPLADREVAVDPEIGRLAIGLDAPDAATAVEEALRVSATHALLGPVGAQPITRDNAWGGDPLPPAIRVGPGLTDLHDALAALAGATGPTLVEITDSGVYDLDLSGVVGTVDEDGGPNLTLAHSLVIRAADGQRPILRLAQPLRARPAEVFAADPVAQQALADRIAATTLRIEGLFLCRGATFPADAALIERAALGGLELVDATLDPGGYRQLDGARAPTILGMSLREPYGFVDGDEERAFAESPTVRLRRSIAGPLRLDRGYSLRLTESIVDAGAGVDTAPGVAPLAIAGATPDAAGDLGYAAPTAIDRATIFGQALLESLHGRGVVFVHRVAVHDHQRGCLRQSYVAGGGDTLPPNLGCVSGLDDAASLAFVGERYADPGYAQLADRSDRRIRTRGPEDDAMGAFGFLLPAHAWQNLELRLRENMPVGVRALLLPVT
ncbi:MAG: hypothetical protein KC486_17180 [Myxococcales bacterium]|nr:hypothetical protein [Myxococcales bacterium]